MKSITNFSSLEDYLAYLFNNTSGIAIANSQKNCSWEQLLKRMDEFLNKYKKTANINKNVPLIVHGHKQISFVMTIYACLLNKTPFTPVDSTYSEKRLERTYNLSKARYVYRAENDSLEKKNDEEHELSERGLAYTMSTSGTTGQPKGVQIGREAVSNLIKQITMRPNLAKPNIFMNQTPFAFDLSMYEVFGNLAYGGCIVLNSREDIANSSTQTDFLAKQQISTWASTPSFAMQQLLNPKLNQQNIPSLKESLFRGEKLGKPVVRMIFQKFPQARIINIYGPTEATVATTYIDITREMLEAEEELPVGYAVLNSDLNIVDGEIWISGIHVMHGYLNNEVENTKRPIIHDNGTRIYKTGDYGFIKDNVLYVLGCRDEQIKLNGYRIELSEIEEEILDLEQLGFESAAVIALKCDTGTVLRLVCFYTSKGVTESTIIGEALVKNLPSYMMPSEFTKIDEIPVSTNHKTDKKASLEKYQQDL